MGAIAVFSGGEGAEVSVDVVRAMLAATPHRGDHVEALVRGRCALACAHADGLPDATLASVDGASATFVGSLDNVAELGKELEHTGDLTAAATPAAVIAAGFSRYGHAFARRLRGVFAAAVTDGDRVYCFRDHVGYEPLFYRFDANGFYAATEAKQVVAGAGIRKEPDLEIVERTLYRDDVERRTALRGVDRLPKATVLIAGDGGVQEHSYWEPAELLERARIAPADIPERFEQLMNQAVARCLTGRDVVLLSGGIDSSAIASFAAPLHLELTGRPFAALSATYPRFPSVDESRYVEILAASLGLRLTTYEQNANALEGLAEWVAIADTPYPAGSLSLYAESFRRARALGCRTILTGEHAEFLYNMDLNLIGHLLLHGRLRAAHWQLARRRVHGKSLASLALLVARSLAPAPYVAIRSRGSHVGVPEWIDRRKVDEVAGGGSVRARDRWRQAQLAAFFGPGVSVEATCVCQAVCGVRVRRPWLDVDLWEFFLGLPAELKFPDYAYKGLVRSMLRERVPDEILDRQDKTDFSEANLSRIDYATLRRFLVAPAHRFAGVDYRRLAERVDREELGSSYSEYSWARNLATAHAFLSQWE